MFYSYLLYCSLFYCSLFYCLIFFCFCILLFLYFTFSVLCCSVLCCNVLCMYKCSVMYGICVVLSKSFISSILFYSVLLILTVFFTVMLVVRHGISGTYGVLEIPSGTWHHTGHTLRWIMWSIVDHELPSRLEHNFE
jgi:hypothetical protein